MDKTLVENIRPALVKFIDWVGDYGETSYDHQSYFAGPIGGSAKALYYSNPTLGTLAVSPMVLSEAFAPIARQLFWKKQRFPIADAHYAMGFALLAKLFNEKRYYDKAVHFLNILKETRCPGYSNYCWGYPFDWVTKNGTIRGGTPLITTTPYVYEAFSTVYGIDKSEGWLEVMKSIVQHAIHDIKDFEFSKGARTCSYTPHDNGGVVNASAYRAFLLTSASKQFSEEEYWQLAEGNLNFVLSQQQPDGSWYYDMDSGAFIDHFHTCFVLKALAKIVRLIDHPSCREAIEKGVEYYVDNLFDNDGLPKPFSKAPRMTVYRNELYDYAECINLCVLLKDKYGELEKVLETVLHDLLKRWQKPDGSFRSRKLLFGWDNVPMHRWAQSQIFRSLCFLLYEENRNRQSSTPAS